MKGCGQRAVQRIFFIVHKPALADACKERERERERERAALQYVPDMTEQMVCVLDCAQALLDYTDGKLIVFPQLACVNTCRC